MTKQLEETKKERDGYIAFEKEVRKQKEREREGPSKTDMDSKIEKLKDEERIAIEQLKTAEKERIQLEEELKALELEEKALEEEEAEYVSNFASYVGSLTCGQVLAGTQCTPTQICRASRTIGVASCSVRCRFCNIGQA